MKKLIFILMLALAAGAAQAQVKFETKSTDAVREMAVKTGKLVFIDLYATWCPPCRTMEREVFSRRDVGDFMEQHFVAAKYDVDKTTGKELLKRYGSGGNSALSGLRHAGRTAGTHTGGGQARRVHGQPANDPRQAEAQTGKVITWAPGLKLAAPPADARARD
ncbi:MAG: thioredoxin family protein [Alistipes onderdonkii]